jgi:seryl-tRNA synthetase
LRAQNPMLDILLFRSGGDAERVRESQRRRYADVGLVDKVIKFDDEWRSCARLAVPSVAR